MNKALYSENAVLQRANLLLRNKEWKAALRTYIELWDNSLGNTQSLISFNMGYILKKAPVDVLGVDVYSEAIILLQASDLGHVVMFDDVKQLVKQPPLKKSGQHVKYNKKDNKLNELVDGNKVLLFSNEMATDRGYGNAIDYALMHMPTHLRHTISVLQANAAIESGDEALWVANINTYLSKFNALPIELDGSGCFLDRLSTLPKRYVEGGPLVTVIMPAWNAELTIRSASNSILNQSWRNIELIIIDDCSTDGTWDVMQELANHDSRVKLLRNKVNVGPYVSKNYALQIANGEWVTGHDADDFALPDRLEKQLNEMIDGGIMASTTNKIRLSSNGLVKCGVAKSVTSDGVSGPAFISCMFNLNTLRDKLGAWDSVRFGGDGEIINRLKLILKDKFVHLGSQLSMICMDLEDSLTNNSIYGICANEGLSEPRRLYLTQYKKWHSTLSDKEAFMPFPMATRPFECGEYAKVSLRNVLANFNVRDN
ncbi:MAG: glycosyltransferase family 2 protein [Gammaproteobacteria bacterium]|nr:glycosyltransferase family 2 protein [Gammaproteobacteria bacterium]